MAAEANKRLRMVRAGVPDRVKPDEVIELPSGAICSKPVKDGEGRWELMLWTARSDEDVQRIMEELLREVERAKRGWAGLEEALRKEIEVAIREWVAVQ